MVAPPTPRWNVKKKKTVVPPELLRLDLGCGDSKTPGFLGVDKYKTASTDFVVDLFKFPWPWKNDSVEAVYASHFFEHVPGKMRGQFMAELYRVMTVGGTATFVTPYWSSMRAIQDYTHEWPPIAESSYLYFNKGWREQNKLTHYLTGACDFDFTYGFALDQETASKNAEAQQFWTKHYVQSVNDLSVTLTKRAP